MRSWVAAMEVDARVAMELEPKRISVAEADSEVDEVCLSIH